jgi:hypothetical protein
MNRTNGSLNSSEIMNNSNRTSSNSVNYIIETNDSNGYDGFDNEADDVLSGLDNSIDEAHSLLHKPSLNQQYNKQSGNRSSFPSYGTNNNPNSSNDSIYRADISQNSGSSPQQLDTESTSPFVSTRRSNSGGSRGRSDVSNNNDCQSNNTSSMLIDLVEIAHV